MAAKAPLLESRGSKRGLPMRPAPDLFAAARVQAKSGCDPRKSRMPRAVDEEEPAMAITREQVESRLKTLVNPDTGIDYVTGKSVKTVEVQGSDVTVSLVLGYPARTVFEATRQRIAADLQALPGVGNVTVHVESKVVPHAVQRGLKLVPNVKNIIAVASGKGGVGKSTVAVNLALALAAEGASVGMLDADIYGPSQPTMLGIRGRPETVDGKSIEPMVGHGVQAMSIGFMIDTETPMVWRGPMVTQALEQLLNETRWRDIDYLVVDLPPGTGDIQLTLAQRVPVTGAVIVTTPQDIALMDARKGLKMFEKVSIPILGLVENMSTHVCPSCGHESHIFGEGGAARMAADYKVEVLGQVPLDIRIREQADSGRPTVVAEPQSRIAEVYRAMARRVAIKIAERQQDHSAAFPKIVVQKT
jgi:ATP-binding protein involved in chromosome partitioning